SSYLARQNSAGLDSTGFTRKLGDLRPVLCYHCVCRRQPCPATYRHIRQCQKLWRCFKSDAASRAKLYVAEHAGKTFQQIDTAHGYCREQLEEEITIIVGLQHFAASGYAR